MRTCCTWPWAARRRVFGSLIPTTPKMPLSLRAMVWSILCDMCPEHSAPVSLSQQEVEHSHCSAVQEPKTRFLLPQFNLIFIKKECSCVRFLSHADKFIIVVLCALCCQWLTDEGCLLTTVVAYHSVACLFRQLPRTFRLACRQHPCSSWTQKRSCDDRNCKFHVMCRGYTSRGSPDLLHVYQLCCTMVISAFVFHRKNCCSAGAGSLIRFCAWQG